MVVIERADLLCEEINQELRIEPAKVCVELFAHKFANALHERIALLDREVNHGPKLKQMNPESIEYPAYYAPYIQAIEGADVSALMRSQLVEVEQLGMIIDNERAMHRYAEGKWSIKELIGHLVDCERIFGYRALCIARGETQPLPGFDENDYVSNAQFDAQAFSSIIEEFLALRLANIILFESFTEAQRILMGNANGNPVSVRAIESIIVGHAHHHLTVLRERY